MASPYVTNQQKADEVVRLASIFSEGCTNTIIGQMTAGHCAACSRDFLARVSYVMSDDGSNANAPSD